MLVVVEDVVLEVDELLVLDELLEVLLEEVLVELVEVLLVDDEVLDIDVLVDVDTVVEDVDDVEVLEVLDVLVLDVDVVDEDVLVVELVDVEVLEVDVVDDDVLDVEVLLVDEDVLEVDVVVVDVLVELVDVVLPLAASIGSGQAAGGRAFFAANFPGWSFRTVPPNSVHQRCEPLVRTTAMLRCAGSSSVIPTRWARILSRLRSRMLSTRTSEPAPRACRLRNLKTSPSFASLHPLAERSNRTHSPVSGLPTCSTAPCSVGSSDAPRAGVVMRTSRATSTRRSDFAPWRMTRRFPPSGWSTAPAGEARHASTTTSRSERFTGTLSGEIADYLNSLPDFRERRRRERGRRPDREGGSHGTGH